MHPHTVSAGGDETALAQIRQMAGDGRLWQPQAVVNMADADLVVVEQREDAQARLVGQSLEQALQLVDGGPGFWISQRLHVFALTNLSQVTYICEGEYLWRAHGRDQ